MTNPMLNPPQNYSGVTIQISNPAVNVGMPDGRIPSVNGGYVSVAQNGLPAQQNPNYVTYPQNVSIQKPNEINSADGQPQMQKPVSQEYFHQQQNNVHETGYSNAYPAQYYLNNYNYAYPNGDVKDKQALSRYDADEQKSDFVQSNQNDRNAQYAVNQNDDTATRYKIYAETNEKTDNDMSKSEKIKEDLAEREAALLEEKNNTKETKIVALTDEYIKSLENYLNNPNDEIRLMASKEILTRLDEDKDRYDDAALNALLNKMMQDPNKLVRISALSAFNSQLASGNDYTVKLLHDIQSNPNSDKEDVLQAADILLKMSAGVEVKNIPNPSVKDKETK